MDIEKYIAESAPEEIKKLLKEFSSSKGFFFEAAYKIAVQAHWNDRRKKGKDVPYITHVERVILGTYARMTPHYKAKYVDQALAIAALHDVFEDHPDVWPLVRIENELYYSVQRYNLDIPFDRDGSNVIISGTDAISKRPKGTEEYTAYVLRVKAHRWARIVKLSDIEDNSSDLEPGGLKDKYNLTKYVLELE